MRTTRPWVVAIVALALLASIAALLFFFGGPQRPVDRLAERGATAPPSNDESGGVSGAPVKAPPGTSTPGAGPQEQSSSESDPMPWQGASGPPPEGGTAMPLIPIPGCRCHSDDPVVVEEHARYTLAGCAECH